MRHNWTGIPEKHPLRRRWVKTAWWRGGDGRGRAGIRGRGLAAAEAVAIQQDTFACSSEFSLHALHSNGGGFLDLLINQVGSWTPLGMDVKVSAGILYMGKWSVASLRGGNLDGEAEKLESSGPTLPLVDSTLWESPFPSLTSVSFWNKVLDWVIWNSLPAQTIFEPPRSRNWDQIFLLESPS